MAYTIEQYNTLVAAIAQGAEIVKYADKEVQYIPYDKAMRLKADMEADLGLNKKPRTRYAQHSKGLL